MHKNAWTPDQIQFLNDNYRTLPPKEIAKRLDMTFQKVVNKMSKDGLSSCLVIEWQMARQMADLLLSMGLSVKDVAEIVGCSVNVAYKVNLVRLYKETPKYTKDVCLLEKACLDQLKKLKVDKYEPNYEEDERFRYRDLSASEKLIYHSI